MASAARDLVVNLTANTKRFTTPLQRARKEAKQFSRVMIQGMTNSLSKAQLEAKQFSRVMIQGMSKSAAATNKTTEAVSKMTNRLSTQTKATNKHTKASTSGVRGLLELSRGAEDAAVSFGVNGLTGAIRGSLNNITQFAFIVGGPAAGAMAGFAAAGVAMIPIFFKLFSGATEKAKDFNKELSTSISRLKELAKHKTDIFALGFGGGVSPDKKGVEDQKSRIELLQKQNDLFRKSAQRATGKDISDFLRKERRKERLTPESLAAKVGSQEKTNLVLANAREFTEQFRLLDRIKLDKFGEFSRDAKRAESRMEGILTKTGLTKNQLFGVHEIARKYGKEIGDNNQRLREQVELLKLMEKKLTFLAGKNQQNFDFLLDSDRRKQEAKRLAERKALKGVTPGPGPNLDFLLDADRIKQQRDRDEKTSKENRSAAKRIKQSLKSPIAKLADELNVARKLKSQGLISRQDFDKFNFLTQKKIKAEVIKLNKKTPLKFAGALERGSAGARSVINLAALGGKKPEENTAKNTKETAKNTKKAAEEIAKLNQNISKGNVQVIGSFSQT